MLDRISMDIFRVNLETYAIANCNKLRGPHGCSDLHVPPLLYDSSQVTPDPPPEPQPVGYLMASGQGVNKNQE